MVTRIVERIGRIRRSVPVFNLVLNQSFGFDVLAALSIGLSKRGVTHRFVYPYPRGPLQGPARDARRFLASYGIPQRLFWDARSWWRRIFTRRILARACSSIVQTPYLSDHFHPKFYESLVKLPNLSYTNYGLNLANTPDLHFALEGFRDFSEIFVSSEQDLAGFREAGIGASKLVVIGNPLVYQIAVGTGQTAPTQRRSELKRILWAPHWDSGWSNWESTLGAMERILDLTPRICMTMRPHPLLLPGLRGTLPEGYRFAEAKDSEAVSRLERFLAHPNVELSTSSLLHDCQQSDLLVTDGVSIVGFWLATGKPLVLLRRPDSPGFGPQFEDLKKHIDFVQPTSADVEAWILNWLNSTAEARDEVEEFSHPHVVHMNGKPADPADLLVQVFE